MPFNGSGVFTRAYSWVAERIAGNPISSTKMDTEFDGFATGLSNAICRDGQTTVTAKIPFGAGINIAAAAPGSPTNGDLWNDSTGLKYRVGTSTLTNAVELIEEGSKAAANTHDFVLPTGYTMLEYVFTGIIPAAGSVFAWTPYINGIFSATGLNTAAAGMDSGGTARTWALASSNYGQLIDSLSVSGPATVKVLIPIPESTSHKKPLIFEAEYANGTTGAYQTMSGTIAYATSAGAITAFRINGTGATTALAFDYRIYGHR